MLDVPDLIPLSDFLPEVAVMVDGAPSDMVESYIRQSAIDLAVRSQVLIRDVQIDVQAGVDEYPVRVGDQERVESLQYMGRKPGACDCPYRSPCGVPLMCGGTAQFKAPDRVFISPKPKQDRKQALWVRVAVAPTRDACEVDRMLYEKYHEAVVNGALARMLVIKGMPWYDAALSTFYRDSAARDITAAGVDRLTGGRRGPFKMRGRRF